jgi:hypothetical protein
VIRTADFKEDIPKDLNKYLESSSLVEGLRSDQMHSNKIKFIGHPIDISSRLGLYIFPGALWRAIMAEALKRLFSNSIDHKNIDLIYYSFTTSFYFIVVDNHVLMETPMAKDLNSDNTEHGTYLGENPSLASHLDTELDNNISMRTYSLLSLNINEIINLGIKNSGWAKEENINIEKVKLIYNNLYHPEGRSAYLNLADKDSVSDVKKRLRLEWKQPDDANVDEIITGLIWDYLFYVAKDEYNIH